MKSTITIITGVLLLVSALNCLVVAAPTDTNAADAKAAAESAERIDKPDKRLDFVKTVDFYLNDGIFVSGKLISEDRNKIIVEQLEPGGMTAATYGRRNIDPRTLRTKGLLEYKYYLSLADHFSARTWDFQNDPDDFIAAIRCYEKARQLLADTDRQDSEGKEITEKIKKLHADRDVWEREAESRAKLKKLEFESALEKKLKDLESRLDTISQQLDKGMKELNTIVTAVQDSYQTFETNISRANEDLAVQLRDLETRVRDNERRIDRRGGYSRYYYRSRSRSPESEEQD